MVESLEFPAPIQRSILIHSGTTFYADYPWMRSGEALSLKGYKAVMSITRRRGTPSEITVSSDDNEIFLEPDGVTGLIRVAIPDTKTSALKWPDRNRAPAQGYYDLVVIDESAQPRRVIRVAQGPVSVDEGVTQLS